MGKSVLIRIGEEVNAKLETLKKSKGKKFSYNTVLDIVLNEYYWMHKDENIYRIMQRDYLYQLFSEMERSGLCHNPTTLQLQTILCILDGELNDAISMMFTMDPLIKVDVFHNHFEATRFVQKTDEDTYDAMAGDKNETA